ncbi:nucleotidyltransferase family protein [uncultured Anaerococcus sp.]|uniref:tRNA(Met) cytidine acetate ligase n=1 Tax=uncultured Anaerococcus sp. TaxID=293428 RepID=UPI00260C47B1|nr:nucleotidyltransferase family protein [uncultured Anaerococcus sp.]
MKSLGIIAEFNPLHNGHKYLIEKAKNELKTDLSVSIMSGDFVQRGEAAIIDKYSRAKTALNNGLDLVIEMPNFISLQSAEFFALKSVAILDKIDIDYLVFGIENINPDEFLNDVNKIIKNQKSIDEDIKTLLDKGLSYPKASSLLLASYVGEDFLSSNNILALEYIKAIYKLRSKIQPYPIKRIKTKNKDLVIKDKTYASSTAIRNNLDSNIKNLIPLSSYQALTYFLNNYKAFDENYIYNIFKYKLFIEKSPMENILGYEQGLDNYLKKLAKVNSSYKSFLDQASSQRYTRSRIKRHVLSYILNNDSSLNDIDIDFIKILAYNKKSTSLFKKIKGNLDIVINKKDASTLNKQNLEIYKKMVEASNLYSLGIGRNLDYDFTHNNRPID